MGSKDYEIKFSGLKLGEHQFSYKLNKEFFDLFEYQGFEKSDLEVNVSFTKKDNSMELVFNLQGYTTVPCDLTNEEFDLTLQNQLELLVKFGDAFDDSNENILILPYGDYKVDISQYLYELAVLSVPLKKIHPDVKSGKHGKDILKKLNELSPGAAQEQDDKETDPRWDKLKTLLN